MAVGKFIKNRIDFGDRILVDAHYQHNRSEGPFFFSLVYQRPKGLNWEVE